MNPPGTAPSTPPGQWALGIQARLTALLSEGESAERRYRESIDRLGRTRARTELARSHLLYEEWLRARAAARTRASSCAAYQMLDAMGARGFAERARRELLATRASASAPRRPAREPARPAMR